VNFVANEGVDRPVVERLRQDGHDVVYVAELSPSITDTEVLQQANDRRSVLLTADKDFGELVFRQGLVHSGAILLRLAGLANVTKAEIAPLCRPSSGTTTRSDGMSGRSGMRESSTTSSK
jgi:predicted nuclease of predicted toxin-antitoxin system